MPAFEDPRVLRRLLELEKKLAAQRRCDAALRKARLVARHLKDRYGVEQVYLYGSLARGTFGPHSDIDIFVVGFGDHRRYWRMQVEVEEIAAPFTVSVVCDDEAPPALKEKVLQRGVLLA
ncbi:MAG: nucleotidyltransferase family protein [Desulfotomaculales bacterium]